MLRWMNPASLVLTATLITGPVFAAAIPTTGPQECNPGNVGDDGSGAPNLPPLQVPFAAGEDWTVGGAGSFFGDYFHCNRYNDYYATDWNRPDDGGRPVYPVAAGVVVEAGATQGSLGHRVVIVHKLGGDAERFESHYAHLQADSWSHLSAGDVVMPWTRIGRVGRTGLGPTAGEHLHLSLKSFDRASNAFRSKCDDPVKGTSNCLSTEPTEEPQGRKPRWMWTDKTKQLIERSGVEDGHTLSSGNRPRIFLPGYRNGDGDWDTDIFVVNHHDNFQRVELRIYDEAGNKVHGDAETLRPDEQWHIDLPLETVGTAVVLGQSGMDLSAVARVQRDNTPFWSTHYDAFAAFEGVEQALTEQQVAVVLKNHYQWQSRIFLFNPDASASVDVTLAFSQGNACGDPITIGPMATYDLDTERLACLDDGFGSLTVRASVGGSTDPGLVALTSYQERRAERLDSLAVVATGQPADRLYVPLMQNDNFDILSGIGVQRAAGSGNLRASFYGAAGGFCQAEQWSDWPVVVAPVIELPNPCETVLAAVFEGLGTSRDLTGQFNQLLGDTVASSYPAIANPTRTAHVPYLDGTNGVLRGIQIQNTENLAAEGTIEFYRADGSLIGAAVDIEVPAEGFLTLVNAPDIPTAARSARIVVSRRIAVVVNNIMGQALDTATTYTAPGRH